ncbi:MAG: pyridoxal-5'-phosphate-dependent protein, partial [Alphaproteobacteria bacterium]|nr:pyridoxal-5'-phosphate-dependent protein [Alphaproteobacteria bacterium]
EMTFAINQPRLGPGFAVTDAEAAAAMRFAFEVLKIVVEPGGAVALAAVLTGKVQTKERAIGVIASGGNCDAALYAKVLRKEL